MPKKKKLEQVVPHDDQQEVPQVPPADKLLSLYDWDNAVKNVEQTKGTLNNADLRNSSAGST